jgi:hypothetical protein
MSEPTPCGTAPLGGAFRNERDWSRVMETEERGFRRREAAAGGNYIESQTHPPLQVHLWLRRYRRERMRAAIALPVLRAVPIRLALGRLLYRL